MAMSDALDEFAESIDIPLFKALVQGVSGIVALGGKATSATIEASASTIDKVTANTQHFSPNAAAQGQQIEKSGPSLERGPSIDSPVGQTGLDSGGMSAPSMDPAMETAVGQMRDFGIDLSAFSMENTMEVSSQAVAMNNQMRQQQAMGIG